MSRHTPWLLAIALAAASPALLAPAAAHTCSAENPAAMCGGCAAGDHHHTYTDGHVYCSSDDPGNNCKTEYVKPMCLDPLLCPLGDPRCDGRSAFLP